MTATLDLAAPASVARLQRHAQLVDDTLIKAALRSAPLQPAVTLIAIEHQALPEILAARFPRVTHSWRGLGPLADEHLFVDTASGEAVRAVLTFDLATGRTRTEIGEVGGCQLWEQLVIRCTEWEMAGRHIPESWTA